MKFCCLAAVLVAIAFPPLVSSNGAWNDPTSSQYHIQTDEGPERYFRYQTQSGQYRKEKRLEDGTVIGTYAWIDSDGMLRLRDYIADNAGYRILRSKNLYVGANSPIEQAIKAARKVPASSGLLAKPDANAIAKTPQISYQYSTPAKLPNTYIPSLPAGYIPQVQITPNSLANADFGSKYPLSSSLPAHVTTLVTTTESPLDVTLSPQQPSSTVLPPSSTQSIVHIPSTTPASGYLPASTPLNIPAPVYVPPSTTPPPSVYLPSSTTPPQTYSTNNPTYATSTPAYVDYQTSTPSNLYIPQPAGPSLAPPLNSNSVEYAGYSSDPQYEHYTDKFVNPYIYQNGPTYPIDKNGHTFNSYTNKIGNGYSPQYPEYDGVSVTNDGFRYYIPRAYHEEQNLPGDKKSGSFGYIDPFGIRRVIYYNTGPGTGFLHRKNNRYVGFNATPYDPRPY